MNFSNLEKLGQNARLAGYSIAKASTEQKQKVLRHLAQTLRQQSEQIQQANLQDLEAAAGKLDQVLLDRLKMTPSAIETCALGVDQLASMPEIIGQIHGMTQQVSGIWVGQMRIPIGVFAMIYESRPNVTIEAAGLAIKSGNACILRGGSEAWHSNQILLQLVQQSLETGGLPAEVVQGLPTTDRKAVDQLLQMDTYIDLIIPRGGKSLIQKISAESKIPVLKHLDGNCHTYIDEPCDLDMAWKITENAKTQKYSPCNATESLLVAKSQATKFLPKMAEILWQKNVQLRCCADSLLLLQAHFPSIDKDLCVLAQESDWYTEYLAPILSIKLVDHLDQAISHINHYSSHHTDAIVTSNHGHAMRFLREVDSASVLVNTSTRFADGFEYGLGAEIGISTDKLHARGPVGVLGLTTQKYVVLGNGEVRE
ncbi:MAG: glutamate-5-semialdehyde dehydrogenase [Gammaproteobacteria bacterium]|nr:glutamate-5-semialdehyde dehydrogenase [Gammaproteobacteria bacterium]